MDNELTDYAYNFIKDICEKFGPRYSSTEAEKKANLWIKDEFEKYLDEVHLEEFKTNPNLYPQGVFKVCGVLAGTSFIFMPFIFPFSILSGIFILLALFVLFTELMGLKRWIKIFFKSGTSSNVWGNIKPTGEMKFRVIFEGHTDSAKVMRAVNENTDPPMILLLFGFVYILYTLILSFVKFIFQIFLGEALIMYEAGIIQWTIFDWIYFIPWLFLFPCFLFLIYGVTGNEVVEGANDNLSGSAVSAAVGKYFSKKENRPKNIEIIIGSMGSEEIGDRGAKYFVENHGDLLKDAYIFVIDSAGAGKEMYIIKKDFMHMTTYSPEVISRMEKAHELYKMENPDVLSLASGNIPLGSSDACMYSKAGYKASFIIVTAGGLKKPANWHSVNDTWQNIDKKVLRDVIGVCLKFVEIVDKEFE